MKKVFKKVDWVQIGVLGLGIAATLAKTIYENKKFNEALDKKFTEAIEKKVDKMVNDGVITPLKINK